MDYLLKIEEIENIDSNKAACSCLAFFANLLEALRLEHLPPWAAAWLYSVLIDRIQEYLASKGGDTAPAGDFSQLHVDELFKLLTDILQTPSNQLFQVRQKKIDIEGERNAVTLQPSWAFQYWLSDEFEETALMEPTFSQVVGFCHAFSMPENRATSAFVGAPSDVVWVTPLSGEVADVLHRISSLKPQERERNCAATPLREVLGLSVRKPREQLVVATTRQSITEMSIDRFARLSAPTVLDSRGYERFHHWPENVEDEDGYGRTFHLNRARASWVGVREAVRSRVPLRDITRFDYVGKTEANAFEDGKPRPVQSDRDFALKVSRGRNIVEILIQLEEVLPE